ncbi:MAG: hypothetical protein NWE95_11810 [Candidatus Bathyarchaeota archaeon]|nr:hypothetical protein [Candidatus Bathyarchaeota archaeon]
MAFSIIGDFYSLGERAKAVGWIAASGEGIAFIIAAPLIGVISDIGNWCSVLLGFALPT